MYESEETPEVNGKRVGKAEGRCPGVTVTMARMVRTVRMVRRVKSQKETAEFRRRDTRNSNILDECLCTESS